MKNLLDPLTRHRVERKHSERKVFMQQALLGSKALIETSLK